MPGSAPPHRIDSANPTNSVINTSQSVDRQPYDPAEDEPSFKKFSDAQNTDPGPNPFATQGQVRNKMLPQTNPQHPVPDPRPQGVVNTSTSIRNG